MATSGMIFRGESVFIGYPVCGCADKSAKKHQRLPVPTRHVGTLSHIGFPILDNTDQIVIGQVKPDHEAVQRSPENELSLIGVQGRRIAFAGDGLQAGARLVPGYGRGHSGSAVFSCICPAAMVTALRRTPSMSDRNRWVSARGLPRARSSIISNHRARRAAT